MKNQGYTLFFRQAYEAVGSRIEGIDMAETNQRVPPFKIPGVFGKGNELREHTPGFGGLFRKDAYAIEVPVGDDMVRIVDVRYRSGDLQARPGPGIYLYDSETDAKDHWRHCNGGPTLSDAELERVESRASRSRKWGHKNTAEYWAWFPPASDSNESWLYQVEIK